jgi:hypothetical protein
MKALSVSTRACVTAIALAMVFSSAASAACVSKMPRLAGSNPAVMSLALKAPAKALQPPQRADSSAPVSIAGLWYTWFLADGQVIDDGFDMWHADGTEVLNDTPAPSSGNLCIGVWIQTSPLTYDLKHPSWIFDATGANLIGVAIIREQVRLDPTGATYRGFFTVDVYDLSGNLLDHEAGQIQAERITPDDDPNQTTGIPGLPSQILNR